MKQAVLRFVGIAAGSCVVALAGGGVIAQQVPREAQEGFSAGGQPATPGESRVSEPEPTPNPNREQENTGGIDPELGPIAEPDQGDIAPAYRLEGDGSWERPDAALRDKARDGLLNGAGLIMPQLVGPNIPIVPLELLFPPETQATGPKVVREVRGTAIIVGALDRENGTNTRLRIPVGGQGTYGSLRMKVTGCYAAHPEDNYEAWAFVEVTDMGRPNTNRLAVLPQRDRQRVKAAASERLLRKGWVIASSPAVTPIDHPTYDMWLIGCEGGVVPALASNTQAGSGTLRRRSQARAASTPDLPADAAGAGDDVPIVVPNAGDGAAAPLPAPAVAPASPTQEKR